MWQYICFKQSKIDTAFRTTLNMWFYLYSFMWLHVSRVWMWCFYVLSLNWRQFSLSLCDGQLSFVNLESILKQRSDPYLERHEAVPAQSVWLLGRSSQSSPPKADGNIGNIVGVVTPVGMNRRLPGDDLSSLFPYNLRTAAVLEDDSTNESTHLIIWDLWCVVLTELQQLWTHTHSSTSGAFCSKRRQRSKPGYIAYPGLI